MGWKSNPKFAAEKPEKTERQKQLDNCDELITLQEYLNDWEIGFISNVRGRLQGFHEISEKQADKLKDIMLKVADRMAN